MILVLLFGFQFSSSNLPTPKFLWLLGYANNGNHRLLGGRYIKGRTLRMKQACFE